MNKLTTKLRIGEKIGLGFGVIGLVFLGVIWFYDLTLRGVVTDYQELNAVYAARQSYAFEIESRLAAMRGAEERFLLRRELRFADEARRQMVRLQEQIGRLAAIDGESRASAAEIGAQAQDFISRFEAIVAAWEKRGLDEDSGLQGAFRDAVHELEARAGNYNVDRPYLLLLQIRRSEKDLGLRRDPQYRARVNGLLDEMASTVAASDLPESVKQTLAREIATYRVEFDAYAELALAEQDIGGGKGPFRDAAHRIEAILYSHYIPGMETQILQLRRREKDYLLRRDDRYVAMVKQIAGGLRDQVNASNISGEEKAQLGGLLDAYERDFQALVEQDRHIARLTAEMDAAAARITPLVEDNLTQAKALVDEMSARIAAASADRARLSLLIAFAATVLGALFAFLLTVRIVRPVREMAGLLERLTHENPTERIAADPSGRDEINAMAISLNTMADHKATFFNWWRSSMQEAIALRDLHAGATDGERLEAAEELRTATMAKLQQINAIKGRLLRLVERIRYLAARTQGEHPVLTREDGAQLRNAAEDIATLVSVVDEA